MNAGQIIMSMMQEVSTTVPDAAVTAGGEQMPGAGGFSDLLVALQTEAGHVQKVTETESEAVLSETEPVALQNERIADVVTQGLEMNNAGAQMMLAAYSQPARMPGVNNQPSHEVDAVQNVQPAPPVQHAEQTPVTGAAAPKAQAFEPTQPVRQAAAVSEQQPARPVPSAPVEMHPKSVEAAVQRQASTPPHQDGRMPVVNTPPSHDVDAVQNVQPAPPVQQAEQTPVTGAAAPKPQAFEPVQSVRQAAAVAEQQPAKPVTSAPVEISPKTVEAAAQRQPSLQPQQDSRMPIVNTPPSQEVDFVQNVAETSAPKQTLEEITFSLARPISISRNQPLEQDRTQRIAFVDRSNIISLDMDPTQSRPTDIQSTSERAEGGASVRSQDAGSTAPATNATNLEPLSARKEQPLSGMPVMSTETLLVKSEMDVLAKETADIRTASLQRPLHGAPDQIAVGTRLENEQQNTLSTLTKEDLLVQQNTQPVTDASLTSDDLMGSSADQTGNGQNPDNRMMNPLVHGQSKPEHHNGAALSSDMGKPEPSGQELPERVAHQVRERLNQHEVKQGSQQITLTLSPENLGELKMSLNLQGQRLSVEILTENRLVRDAILQHSDSLKESLARQNIAVESFDVTANGRGSGNSGHNQDAWKELARQKQQQHFWTSNSGYHPTPLESQINPLAYRAGNEQAMLDIHY